MFANAYKGRRVFVTGHTGFKGSWLAAWLTNMGAVVGGFSDCVPTTPSHYDAMNLGAHLEADLRGDIRDREAMQTGPLAADRQSAATGGRPATAPHSPAKNGKKEFQPVKSRAAAPWWK